MHDTNESVIVNFDLGNWNTLHRLNCVHTLKWADHPKWKVYMNESKALREVTLLHRCRDCYSA